MSGAPGPPPAVLIHRDDLQDSAWNDTCGSGLLERKDPEPNGKGKRPMAAGRDWGHRTKASKSPVPVESHRDMLHSFSKEL